MIIAGNEIQPGEKATLLVNIARLPSHTNIDLVIHVNRSLEPGPVVLLSGGLHGDEINGIEIVRRVIDADLNIPKIGTIICLPIINMYGFINFSRYVPDGKDVNSSFPGSKTGSLASRLAHFLTNSILPVIDYGFDFHTGGDNRANYPQVRCNFKDETAKELALATNAPFIMDSPLIPKSLRNTAFKMGKSLMVYEG
ncbi:MAG: succinylglutamate desuccinylase/aspartoacylase family protein, partial [Cyclobacteriaceae bacterium]